MASLLRAARTTALRARPGTAARRFARHFNLSGGGGKEAWLPVLRLKAALTVPLPPPLLRARNNRLNLAQLRLLCPLRLLHLPAACEKRSDAAPSQTSCRMARAPA